MDKTERNRRMKRCSMEDLNIQDILDDFSWSIFADLEKSSNLPREYLFLSIMVTMCHWMNGAMVEGVNFYKIPMILFGVLCGGSGSKKSGPIRLVKEASEQVESLKGIAINDSSLNSSATMESVCHELQTKPHLLQVWDELAVFLALFGSTRSDRAAYDRGILCELYSPTNYVRRQLVTRTNIMIKPRLNILAAGHPKETINCLTGTGSKFVESNDDGLFNRFLFATAFKRVPVQDCPSPSDAIPKLAHLFYLTSILHKNQMEYRYSNEGKLALLDSSIHSSGEGYAFMKATVFAYDSESSLLSNEDDFLSSNLTKAIEQVQRISCVLHVLKSVSKILFDLRENHQIRFYCLNDKFKEIVISNTQNQIEFLIEQDSCEKAKKVVDYYLRIKKILAGYDPVKNKTFVENSIPLPIPLSDIEQIKNYIKNHSSDRILLSTLPSNVKRKYTKEQYLQILHDMQMDGDGVVTSTDNSTGPKAIVFVKKRRTDPTRSVTEPSNTNTD